MTTVTSARLGVIYTSLATVTVSNTLVETTLLGGAAQGSLTLPANFWTVGRTLRFKGWGIQTMPGGSPSLQNRLKLGAVTIGDTTALVDKNDTNTLIMFDAMVTCRTTGATGTVYCMGFVMHHEGTVDVNMFPFENTTTSTIDTTAAMTIDLTVQFSTNSGVSFSLSNFIIESLN